MQINKLQLDYKPVQLILPVNYEHIIDDCDQVVSFKEVVGGLNLRKFIKTSLKGRHDYDPEVMLHLILFGFMENIRSLRKLEQACRNDIRFMYLGNSIKPSFMAFQRFIDDKLTESIDDIFYTINQFLIEKENINTEVLHVDGTKIEANANKFTFVWKKA
ncbi:transposase, partial [Thiopseudomonas sp. 4R-3cl]